MNMGGAVVPKDPSVRARRNKSTTRATLHAVDPNSVDVPPLPDDGGEWHNLTVQWWNDIWCSPMAAEWDDSDKHGLYMLAVLVDQFWHDPSTKLAAEIRLQRVPYGLTPVDRRRLEWEIDRGEEASANTRAARNTAATGVPAGPASQDPRLGLQ